MMNSITHINKIDRLNIFLLLLSVILAILIPFRLFVFSYAFIGPLHYLTEINWLKEKMYFISNSGSTIKLFVFLSIAISLLALLNLTQPDLFSFLEKISNKSNVLLFALLLIAVCLVMFKNKKHLIIALIICFSILFIMLVSYSKAFFYIGLLLPTIIHVYLFTLVFIVLGAFKSRSKSGFILAVLLLITPFLIYFLPIEELYWEPRNEDLKTVIDTNFSVFSDLISNYSNQEKTNLITAIGIKVQIFLAFTYTYHYLNWFTKTNVIGWSKSITKTEIILISAVWLFSIAIYSFNFMYGFYTLFFLSYLHVVMEFPLDIISIRELIKGLLINRSAPLKRSTP